jgi:hypothetical protein
MKTLGYLAVLALCFVGFFMLMYPSARVHVRVTVEVETPEGLKTGFAVNQLGFAAEPAIGTTGFTVGVGHGEAVAVDLGARGTLYALLSGRNPKTGEPEQGSTQAGMFMTLIAKTSLKRIGGGRDVVNAIRAANGKADVPANLLPFMVRFGDETNPKTVEAVDPENLAASFGDGVRLKRVTIERTDDPVTTGIEKRLGWLVDPAVIQNPGWKNLPSLAQQAVMGLRQPIK